MLKDNRILKKYNRKMIEMLNSLNLSESEVVEIMIGIDQKIWEELAEERYEHLTPEQQKDFDSIDSQKVYNETEIASFLNISVDQMIENYLEKLQEYITLLSKNYTKIKEEFKKN